MRLQETSDLDTGSGGMRKHGSLVRLAGWISRLSMLALTLGSLAAIGGFLHFQSEVSALKAAELVEKADGIVVLTGGKSRIETALDLLEKGKGKRLLISGVHPRSTPAAIRDAVGGKSAIFDCCVDLDRDARDTIGNAVGTAKWARANGFASVIIVTSDYHMPRSLMEMQHELPEIRFIPHPVQHESGESADDLSDPSLFRLMASEYLKYLATSIRYRFVDAERHAALAGADTI